MRAVITLADLPPDSGARLGFSVHSYRDSTDQGVTQAGFLTQQLTETLARIAQPLEDRLIEREELEWLVWKSPGGDARFPPPVQERPHRWSREAVMAWLRLYRPHRIDQDLARAFLRRPSLNR